MVMTHIPEARVICNHAAMGGSTPPASDAPLTVTDILRAAVRRRAGRIGNGYGAVDVGFRRRRR